MITDGREGVVLAEGEQVEAEGLDGVEGRQVCSLIDFVQLVVNVAAAELITGRNVVVDALNVVLEVLKCGIRDGNRADAVPTRRRRSRWPEPPIGETSARGSRHGHILLEYPELVALRFGSAEIAARPLARRRQHLRRRGCCQRDALALKVSEEKQFVFDDGPPNVAP